MPDRHFWPNIARFPRVWRGLGRANHLCRCAAAQRGDDLALQILSAKVQIVSTTVQIAGAKVHILATPVHIVGTKVHIISATVQSIADTVQVTGTKVNIDSPQKPLRVPPCSTPLGALNANSEVAKGTEGIRVCKGGWTTDGGGISSRCRLSSSPPRPSAPGRGVRAG